MESTFGLLNGPLPLINDTEGLRVPASLPFIVDAHVHFCPDHFFSAIWQWFDQFGWPIRYRLRSPQIVDFLISRGVNHIVGLQLPCLLIDGKLEGEKVTQPLDSEKNPEV